MFWVPLILAAGVFLAGLVLKNPWMIFGALLTAGAYLWAVSL